MGDGTKYGAIAAADFKKPPRVRKKFCYETNDEFIAADEPEMLGFDFRKRLESLRVHSADRIGKLRREHWNPSALPDDMPAPETSPARRPNRFIRGDRFDCIASEASASGYAHTVHVLSALGALPIEFHALLRAKLPC
ncbi:hypothetical protein [Bradyrhizobium sp.]|uniref:hypothetical protein n=1 Tax=Bradyrhizobium sp. TaxID=376 RepID=UPI002E021179|nr:hypothetical protein [Bradyrhizobium sp.]